MLFNSHDEGDKVLYSKSFQ